MTVPVLTPMKSPVPDKRSPKVVSVFMLKLPTLLLAIGKLLGAPFVIGGVPDRVKLIGRATVAARVIAPVEALTSILLPAVSDSTPVFATVGSAGFVGTTEMPAPAVMPVRVPPPPPTASRLIVPGAGFEIVMDAPELVSETAPV